MSEKRIKINKSKCISCGACVATSPNQAIYFDEDNKATVDTKIVGPEDDIVIDVCPTEAIELHEFDNDKKEYKN